MTHPRVSLALVLCAVAALACAKREQAAAPGVVVSQSSGPGTATQAITTTATVENVDQKKRTVTLRSADGERSTIRVGDEVPNLHQVKKGDVVTMTYYESLTLSFHEKASNAKPSVSTNESMERAPLGAKPAGTLMRETTITAKVTAVDRRDRKVTLEGPEGGTLRLQVQDLKDLEGIDPGDMVEARYREALAIAVEKPAKK